ncbi:BON domain-containing protein [Silvibacterium sp.]|uniref:BON domain-containing protein n=1 Tax=Silvibacterium sp. TaxID=1964179 RepID=UPI0039E628EA
MQRIVPARQLSPLRHRHASVLSLALTGVLALSVGCHQAAAPAPPSDQQLTSDIQAKLSGEGALNGQNIQVAVNGGVATLSGTANDDASRSLAGNDAGSITGVKTVVNNLTVAPPAQAVAPAPAPPPAPAGPTPAEIRAERRKEAEEKKEEARKEREAQERAAANQAAITQQQQANALAQTPTPPPAQPAAPPPPPKPVAKTVTLPQGTVVPVRMIDTLDSANAQPNQSFRATLAGDLIADGMVALPQGTVVIGRVTDAKDAAHFKGSSLLTIELTSVEVHGHTLALVTDTFSKEGAGRGKNTLAKSGGGAAFGAIVGALAGGGKGAAIGALAGGGAGAAVNGVTRGQQVQIPSESLVNFHLQSAISVTTTRALGAPRERDDSQPQLMSRPQ